MKPISMNHLPHKMKTGYYHILMSAFLMLWFCGAAAASVTERLTHEERLRLTENQSRITLAIETGYPPFVFINDDDQPAGLAHDYMALVESKLGVRFNQKRFSSLNDIFEKVRAGAEKEHRSVFQETIVLLKAGILSKLGDRERRKKRLEKANVLDIDGSSLPDPADLIREDRER